MDAVTLALSKNYTDSKQIAGEFTRSLTFGEEPVANPFPDAESLIGKRVTVKWNRGSDKPYLYLTTPTKRPDGDDTGSLGSFETLNGYSVNISYGTMGGVFSHNVLYLSLGSHKDYYCPTIAKNYPYYDLLMYAYEETHDTMGLGATIQKGWYVANQQTFAFEPIDINDNPVITKDTNLLHKADEYMQQLFRSRDGYSFTIQQKNLITVAGNPGAVVCFADVSSVNIAASSEIFLTIVLQTLVAFTAAGTAMTASGSGYECTLHYTETKTIDPKYLPEGGVGYTELAKTIKVTYDQYQNSTAPVRDGMKYVKISDSPLPLDRITEFTMCIDPALAEANELPERVVRHSEEFELEEAGGYMQALLIDELVVMQSVHENAPGAGNHVGFHVLAQVDENGKVVTWFTDFKFGEEVVHPIDPKYLPDGVGAAAALTFTEGVRDIVHTPESILTLPSVGMDVGDGMTYLYVKLADYVDPTLLIDKSVVSFFEAGDANNESGDTPITADMVFDMSAEVGMPAGTVWLIANMLMMVSAPVSVEGLSLSPGLWAMTIVVEADGVKTVGAYVSKFTNYPGKKKLSQSCIENGMLVIDLADYGIPDIEVGANPYFNYTKNSETGENTFTESAEKLFNLLVNNSNPKIIKFHCTDGRIVEGLVGKIGLDNGDAFMYTFGISTPFNSLYRCDATIEITKVDSTTYMVFRVERLSNSK